MLPVRVKWYVREVKASLVETDNSIEQVYKFLKSAKDDGNTVWVLGNGGSLAIAQHFAQDLIKLCSVRAIAVNDPSLLTAYTNDHEFAYSSYGPLQVLRKQGDPVLIFSCSGKSRNYIEFVSQENHPLLSIVGMTGGFLKEKSDAYVLVKSDDYQVCETAFCIVADILVKSLMEKK